MAKAQTSTTSEDMNIFQDIPWLMVMEGLVLVVIYIWVFLYLTNDEAVGQFKKDKTVQFGRI